MLLEALKLNPKAFAGSYDDWVEAEQLRWEARLRQVPVNLIIVLDGTDVGQGSIGLSDDGTPELISLWIAPGSRRTGVADTLVRALLDVGEQVWPDTALQLHVYAANTAAVRLYTRHGFRAVNDDDELLMVHAGVVPLA